MSQAPVGGFPSPHLTDPPNNHAHFMDEDVAPPREPTPAQVTLKGKGQSQGGYQVTDPKSRALSSLEPARGQDPVGPWAEVRPASGQEALRTKARLAPLTPPPGTTLGPPAVTLGF